MLRGLSTCLSFFSVLIDVDGGSIAVQSHTTKLHCSTVDGVVSWHNYCLLLLHNTALQTRATATLPEGIGMEGGGGSSGRSGSTREIVSVKSTAHGTRCRSGGSRLRSIRNLCEVRLRQIVLSGRNISRGRGRCFGSWSNLGNRGFGCFFRWNWNRGRGRSRRGGSSRSRSRGRLRLGFRLGRRLRLGGLLLRCRLFWGRCWRGGRFLLRRRRWRFREQASPALLRSFRNHTTLGSTVLGLIHGFCRGGLTITWLLCLGASSRFSNR